MNSSDYDSNGKRKCNIFMYTTSCRFQRSLPFLSITIHKRVPRHFSYIYCPFCEIPGTGMTVCQHVPSNSMPDFRTVDFFVFIKEARAILCTKRNGDESTPSSIVRKIAHERMFPPPHHLATKTHQTTYNTRTTPPEAQKPLQNNTFSHAHKDDGGSTLPLPPSLCACANITQNECKDCKLVSNTNSRVFENVERRFQTRRTPHSTLQQSHATQIPPLESAQ